MPTLLDTCQQFDNCPRPATGDAPHPHLGMVPTCDQCAAVLGLPLIPFKNQE